MASSADANLDRNYHHEFEQIHNFRDVASSINSYIRSHTHLSLPKLKEGLLFRSGRLDEATQVDLEKLGSGFAIKTVIDLRTKSERALVKKKHEPTRTPQTEEEVPLLREAQPTRWQTVRVHFIGRQYELQMLKEF
ncbi:hypothetical protein PM082_001623 [Marasmius tenuissimus]|nr:hypothetical protein PM082_001623 [Marasmius tenuissimus]